VGGGLIGGINQRGKLMTNKEIENRRNEIYAERHNLDKEIEQLDFEEGKNTFGEKYPIGSTIEHQGKKYVIRTYERSWVKVSPIKKDGTPSEKIEYLWGIKE
jgi:hypothetical protein